VYRRRFERHHSPKPKLHQENKKYVCVTLVFVPLPKFCFKKLLSRTKFHWNRTLNYGQKRILKMGLSTVLNF